MIANIPNKLEYNLKTIVLIIDENIKKVRWTNEEIDQKFASRTIKEIITERGTHYMNPCLDLTLCSMNLIKRMGYKTNFIVEGVKQKDKEFNGIHFALELEDRINKGFLDYSQLNIVHVGRGDYENKREDVDSLFKFRINGSLFSDNKFFLESFKESNISELNQLIQGDVLEKYKQRLKNENTNDNHNNYLSEIKGLTNSRIKYFF